MKAIKNGVFCVALVAIGLVGCANNPSPPKEITFANDSWANVIKYANMGIDALVEHYHPANNTFVITQADTRQEIKNKIRQVTIDGYGTFDVFVIGECINALSESSNKVATLTFSFKECVTVKSINSYSVSYYPSSEIKRYLNVDLLNAFPLELKTNVKSVDIPTTIDSKYITNSPDKLFLPSEYEIVRSNDYGLSGEGEPYPFYFINTKKEYLNKHYNGTPISYWTRSVSETNKALDTYVSIDIFGGASQINKCDECLGISPLFAIGENAPVKTLYTTSSSAFFTENIRYPIESNKISNVIKYKAYQFSDGQNIAPTSIKEDTDAEFYENFNFNENLLAYNPQTGAFTTNNLTSVSKVIFMHMAPLSIDVSFDKLVEIATEDEQNNHNGDLIRHYLNVGDYLNLDNRRTTDIFQLEVIGCGHDTYLTSDGKTKTAAVTFDTRLSSITKEIPYDNQNDNSCYTDSLVHQYLNATDDESFLSIIRDNSEIFYNNLKNIIKPVYHAYGLKEANTWEIINVPAKVWSLSSVEINLTQRIDEAKLSQANFLDGKPYDFYELLPSGPREAYRKLPEDAISFKLRTPVMSDVTRKNLYLRVEWDLKGPHQSSVEPASKYDAIVPLVAI